MPADSALWVACLVAYYGFLRKLPASELVAIGKYIAWSDLVDFTLSSFSIKMCKSKKFNLGKGYLAFLKFRVLTS